MPDVTSTDRANMFGGGMTKEAAMALLLRSRQLQMQEAQAMGDAPQASPMMPMGPSSLAQPSNGTPGSQMRSAAMQAQLAQMLRARQMQAQLPVQSSQPPQPDGSALLGN